MSSSGVAGGGAATFLPSDSYKLSGVYETSYRDIALSIDNGFGPASGTLCLSAVAIPANFTIGHIAFLFSNGSTTLTNSWFALYDNNRVMLAQTADQLTANYAANAVSSLAIAKVASGSASTFTTTYSGLHYIGTVQAGSARGSIFYTGNGSTAFTQAPILAGTSDTGLTTPTAFPHTAGALTSTFRAYGYVAA